MGKQVCSPCENKVQVLIIYYIINIINTCILAHARTRYILGGGGEMGIGTDDKQDGCMELDSWIEDDDQPDDQHNRFQANITPIRWRTKKPPL